MLVAKLITSIFTLLILLTSYSQSIEGSYQFTNNAQTVEYSFNNNKFSLESSSSLTHGIGFSNGYYLIREDTLLLFYDSTKNPHGISKYEIVKQEKTRKNTTKDIAIVSLVVLDNNENPLESSVVSLQRDENTLAIFPQSDDGTYFIQTEGKIATDIRISNFEVLNIPLASLWNQRSEIVAKLVPFSYNKYNQDYRIEKYIIQEKKGLSIILLTEKGNQITLIKK